jgi:hypothetical protein
MWRLLMHRWMALTRRTKGQLEQMQTMYLPTSVASSRWRFTIRKVLF